LTIAENGEVEVADDGEVDIAGEVSIILMACVRASVVAVVMCSNQNLGSHMTFTSTTTWGHQQPRPHTYISEPADNRRAGDAHLLTHDL